MHCHKCGSQVPEDAIFCQKCGTKISTDISELPIDAGATHGGQRPVFSSGQEPGRGALILVLGILSMVILGPLAGIPAWVMGSKDLKRIRQGAISDSERTVTKVGMILGIIGTFLILTVIIAGILVAVGITLLSDSAINANRDALANDLANLASRAQQYYHRPTSLGGGGESFDGLNLITQLTNKPQNANGSYSIEVPGSGKGLNALVVIKGVGNEIYNGTAVTVDVFVYPDRDSLVTVN